MASFSFLWRNGTVSNTEYDDLAAFYDYEWQELTEDIGFIAGECGEAGMPVLELACGTGRVTIPVASGGLEIWGVDNSRRMLEIFEEKLKTLPSEVAARIHPVFGGMEDFSLDRKFRCAFVPFNSFLLLTSREDQNRCLRNVYHHLEDDGTFIVDIFSPRFDLCAQEKSDIRFLRHFYYPPEDLAIIQWEYVERNMAEQVMSIDFLYEWYDRGGTLKRAARSLKMAVIFRYEMQHLLEKNGFEVVRFYGNYDRTPFSMKSPQMIFICRKRRRAG